MTPRFCSYWLFCSLVGLAMTACDNGNDSMMEPVGDGGTGNGGAGGTGVGGFGEGGGSGSAAAGSGGAGGVGDAGTSGTGGSSRGEDASTAGSDGMAGMGGSGGMTEPASVLPPVDDYAAAGPFGTTMTSNEGPDGNYTLFRPAPLGEDGFMHAPVIFGPGILTSPPMYSALLNHLASHGFVLLVVNSLGGGPGSSANVEAMRTGLDWLLAQNGASGTFEGRLAVDRAVTMGYSLGATASVQLSSHEAITTTVAIHGHDTAGDPHGPVLLLTGTDDVIDSVRNTLATLEEAPALMTALPIGHLDVLTELAMNAEITPSARYIAPITAWLRYWVYGDEGAKRFFVGPDCVMCSSPWEVTETNAAWDAQML